DAANALAARNGGPSPPWPSWHEADGSRFETGGKAVQQTWTPSILLTSQAARSLFAGFLRRLGRCLDALDGLGKRLVARIFLGQLAQVRQGGSGHLLHPAQRDGRLVPHVLLSVLQGPTQGVHGISGERA